MNNIKCLERSVYNSLRSSVVLFDLTRVVEELTYNSIDAGATKVHVYIGVGACYAKIEDDGCGITRDGLVILGQGNVIVRDLFCDQPVRRKYMQTSSKRVLHSVKKCILQIALVHPQLSFKMTDIDSEDLLLCTIPSSSPLPLVSDVFGIEISSSLHEMSFCDQTLLLSGYMSGLTDYVSTKAFQYLYINSRFVCNGPIDNLLNSLAANVQCSLAQQKNDPVSHLGKRQKSHGYPAYLFNLCCPLSSYDLHFEPSKTIAEFKDCNAVLSFFEQAIKHFWEQLSAESLQGKSSSQENVAHIASEIQEEDMWTISKLRKSNGNALLHQDPLPNSPITDLLDASLDDVNAHVRHGVSYKWVQRSPLLKPCRNETAYSGQTDYSCEAFASMHDQVGSATRNDEQWRANVCSSQLGNHLFSNQIFMVKDENDISGQEWMSISPAGPKRFKEESRERESESLCLMENEQSSSVSFTNNNGFSDGFDHIGKGFCCNDIVDPADANCHMENFAWDPLLQERIDATTPSFSFKRKRWTSMEVDDSDIDDAVAANYRKESSVWDPFFKEIIDDSTPSFSFSGKCQTITEVDVSLTTPSFSPGEVCFIKEDNVSDGQTAQFSLAGSKCRFPESEWDLVSPQESFVRTPEKVDDFAQGYYLTGNLRSSRNGCHRYSGVTDAKSETLNYFQSSPNRDFPVSYTESKLDYDYCSRPKRNMEYGFPSDQNIYEKISPGSKLNNETDWFSVNSPSIKVGACLKSPFNISVQNQDTLINTLSAEQEYENHRPSNVHMVGSKRSCSAPPFYEGKHECSTSNNDLATAGKDSVLQPCDAKILSETIFSQNGSSLPSCPPQPKVRKISQPCLRECINGEVRHKVNAGQNVAVSDKALYNQSFHTNFLDRSIPDELECASPTMIKWRTGIPQHTDGEVQHSYSEHDDDILSIFSGILHLSGSLLVPDSINKDCLQDAKVLLQLDKKFIPAIAGGTLIIIDQHAADERIRLEELRQKVLSGEDCNLTYLDSEVELVLPEMGFQLLQKYEEQIQKWGWICSMHSQCSESFAKNMNLLKRRACGVTLSAVPCVLGINLTDKDLIEFIEQLVETDGSSTIPPSVLRILNFKACRGAIMFGDSLLPSECSLIVEELKATSLCFQCAHGRPTTVPLLNMEALREQLAKLQMRNVWSEEKWHGLYRRAPSIERVQLRLESAKRFHIE